MPNLKEPSLHVWQQVVQSALLEDRSEYDITTQSTVLREQIGTGVLRFKQSGTLAGITAAETAFTYLDPSTSMSEVLPDGTQVESGGTIAIVSGKLQAILSAERVALNLLQQLSGIATLTTEMVSLLEQYPNVGIVDTRKTTPGLRSLERYAVRCGGGSNHRDNLQDGVLIKDNHIAAAQKRGIGIIHLISDVRKQIPHTLRIEIEADTPELAHEAALAGADIVMLDNMTPDTMKKIVRRARELQQTEHVMFEASGGITNATIEAVAAAGVDLISVGALTHSAPAIDIALDISIN
ncbi:MAG TPA: carboxylating nicotinate-nucleotide diphosphorylase [Dehalococcoidia bacterium]|nr:carboxylating nicotinate-nucleotide diphosphorylase [Dehalococcoidia bacterium]